MKHLKLLIAAAVIIFSSALKAQTLKDATDSYNSAVQLIATDKGAAIAAFEKCIDQCNAVGAEADSLKQTVIAGLPGVYYDRAMDLYKDKKIEESLVAFQKAAEAAGKYGDEGTQKKAESTEPKLYFAIGYTAYSGNDLDKALVNFKKATELDPDYTKAWFAMGLVYRKKDDLSNMLPTMDKAIAAGNKENDQKTVEQATKVARDYLLILADKSKGKEEYSKAMEYLKKSLVYDEKYSDTYYFMSVIANKLSKWDDAVEAGKKALTNNSSSDDAKIQYELGTAYMNLNDTGNACAAFKAAMANKNYEQSCKYFMEQKLKCQ